ncbi:unnamed protein product [Protopolystoma xenopodis]|uniref:Uncharacterized protein n=1 Tax=Protopolystoma xenopodis TaxID=117903 RepID=A0A3S4ZPV7_9PLAT|nr:unnamed protein product [Protopolystoma xenopodis]
MRVQKKTAAELLVARCRLSRVQEILRGQSASPLTRNCFMQPSLPNRVTMPPDLNAMCPTFRPEAPHWIASLTRSLFLAICHLPASSNLVLSIPHKNTSTIPVLLTYSVLGYPSQILSVLFPCLRSSGHPTRGHVPVDRFPATASLSALEGNGPLEAQSPVCPRSSELRRGLERMSSFMVRRAFPNAYGSGQ